jgi:hypothetical protein
MKRLMRSAVPALVGLTIVVGAGFGAAEAQVIVGERAMPAPIVEVVPARPSPRHVWVNGHHVYEGGH